MTTTARQRKTINWKKNILRIACWNIASWSKRDQEIIIEMNEHKIDICALSETKKKGRGTGKYQNYILIHSGRTKEDRATSGVGLLIHEKFENNIENIEYTNHRLLKVTLRFENKNLHLISVYAPDSNKSKEEVITFYNNLQTLLDETPSTDQIILLGDLNARIGNDVINGVKQRFNEDVVNENGEHLIEFSAWNELRINNTFYSHKEQHKFTWSNTRGHRSTIDYIITNRMIHPSQILDVRVLSSANIGSDHNIVLCKLRIRAKQRRTPTLTTTEKLNVELLAQESTRTLYENRLNEKILYNCIKEDDDNCSWEKLRLNMTQAANEALGTRKTTTNANRKSKPWFTEEVKTLAQEKRSAYLEYRSNKIPSEYRKYVIVRNRVNAEIRELKRGYWMTFTKSMEHDLYGTQKRVWSLIRNLKKPVNEYTQLTRISGDVWTQYLNQLFNNEETNHESGLYPGNNDEHDYFLCTNEQISEAMKKLKNRKATGIDNISNEMIKYGGDCLKEEIMQLFLKIFKKADIPEEWRLSLTIPIFKKGLKSDPANYRTITLLNTTLKLLTSIIRAEIINRIDMSEEQQGFRKNKSTTDAIFITRQIAEKSIEFCKPAFTCFIDLTKAFDRIKLKDVLNILYEKGIPSNIVKLVQALNTGNKTILRMNNEATDYINIRSGIRQGDSLSPILFNLVMDKIIEDTKRAGRGYRLSCGEIKIICYADDAVIIAEDEDNLQKMLYRFEKTSEQYNMQISSEKTKCLVIAREPVRCKLSINNTSIEQVMSFRYLGVELSSYGDLTKEVFCQTAKAAAVSGCLRSTIWRNEFLNIESKVRIYKACIRPISTYAIEARADNSKSKRLLRTSEMKTLRCIAGKTLRDHIRNDTVREMCNIKDIVRWGRQRRRGWNEHVSRMGTNRLAKIARDGKVIDGQRPPGRPHTRWRDSWQSTSQENAGNTSL